MEYHMVKLNIRLILMETNMWGKSNMEYHMVKEHTLSPNGDKYVGEWPGWEKTWSYGTLTVSLNGEKYVGDLKGWGKTLVKEHTLSLMEGSMWGNTRMTKNMVMEHSFGLMETSMLGNGRMGKKIVKEHTLGQMETSM